MPFVRLREIPRTISFRTALMSLALFGFSFLALFGYVYWQTAGYLAHQTDKRLERQIESRSQQPPKMRLHELQEHIEQDRKSHSPHTLFDAQGRPIMGAVQKLPSFNGYDEPHEFVWHKPNGHRRPIRFMVHPLEDGMLLLVGEDIHSIQEFDELLVNALLSGGAVLLVVGLLGAVLLGYLAGRRLDALSRSIERIIKGDLSNRLPTRGNDDDIDRIATIVNGMLDELERLMSEVKGVCDDIAHDLRTPLTRLLAGLERTQRHALSQEQYARAIEAAIAEAQGLLQTFRALLRITEIEDSARRRNFTQVDLDRIGADASEFFEPLAEARGIALEFSPAPVPSRLAGDAQLLFDATCNLLDNAIKFSPDNGWIQVKIIAEQGRIGLRITDNGPGIPEAEREAVFRRLYRCESSRHTAGNGLGLSMVAAVARLHDMILEVHDAQPGCRIDLIQASQG
ncbi:sensor histidine kinase [Azomonas macrocytogenes]|uniref:histidine kinase n=1 Tax=Azomonas macrocytogenes TaxID=69962 RepID=A0A839T183_AZOMA|nr:ATP-binding protein [Azomonas macrocytogenes]MBB3103152.1 signal transduction histidine kinase [Azomonas macrocytogenes]